MVGHQRVRARLDEGGSLRSYVAPVTRRAPARLAPQGRVACRVVTRCTSVQRVGVAALLEEESVRGCRACGPALDAPTQGLASGLVHRCSVASWPWWCAVLPVCGPRWAGHRLARTAEARPWLQRPRLRHAVGRNIGGSMARGRGQAASQKPTGLTAALSSRTAPLWHSASKPEGSLERAEPGRTRHCPVARSRATAPAPLPAGDHL